MSTGPLIEKDVPLKKFCTFSIGGNARYYISVKSFSDLIYAFKFSFENKLPYFVLGNGSNVFFDDRGFNGIVIHNKIDFCEINGRRVFVGAGYLLPKLSFYTFDRNLFGLEFFAGIPASVGGAVYMNAGAEGSCISDLLEDVVFIKETGEEIVFQAKDFNFGYRFSGFQKIKGSIAAVSFLLSKKNNNSSSIGNVLENRMLKQPKGYTAGCVFKNPEGDFAGRLIDKCGLKGFSVGGAFISSKHANFIINKDKAKSSDVLELIDLIKKRVEKYTGVLLQEEVLYIPYTKEKVF